MNKNLQDFEELIAAFYLRARSKSEAESALKTQCLQMLGQVPQALEALIAMPDYAAMTFYGSFQFIEKRFIGQLASENPPAKNAIIRLRERKALKVAASAHPAWTFLIENDQAVLWSAIKLNAALKNPGMTTPDEKFVSESEFEDGESDFDTDLDMEETES